MMIDAIGSADAIMMHERDANLMAKRHRPKYPPRTRQPRRPVTTSRTNPLHGPAICDHRELHARLVNGKAF